MMVSLSNVFLFYNHICLNYILSVVKKLLKSLFFQILFPSVGGKIENNNFIDSQLDFIL